MNIVESMTPKESRDSAILPPSFLVKVGDGAGAWQAERLALDLMLQSFARSLARVMLMPERPVD